MSMKIRVRSAPPTVAASHDGLFSYCQCLFIILLFLYQSSNRLTRVSLRNDPQPTAPGEPDGGGNFKRVELAMKSSIRIVGFNWFCAVPALEIPRNSRLCQAAAQLCACIL